MTNRVTSMVLFNEVCKQCAQVDNDQCEILQTDPAANY